MNDAFAEHVEKSRRALAEVEKELSQQDENLWCSTEFGARADQFADTLREAFAGVVPPEEERKTKADVPVDDWEIQPARRKRPQNTVTLIIDLLLAIVGLARPAKDYLQTVATVTRVRWLEVTDPREPGGGPKEVKKEGVPVHEVVPPKRELPTGRYEIPLIWGWSFSLSSSWLHRFHQAWLRLSERATPDAEFEPTLRETTRTISVPLAEIPLDICTPVQRAYWSRRHEIRRDVQDITDFIIGWDAKVNGQSGQTRKLCDDAKHVAELVAVLPGTDDGPKKVKEIRDKIEEARSRMEQQRKESRQLLERIEELKQEAKRVRPELFS